MNILTTHSGLSLILIISISIYGTTGKSVFDTDGNEVKPGVNYVIRASYYNPSPESRGWLSRSTIGESPCPLYVVQDTSNPGLPLTFHPVNNQDTVIHTSTGLNITFNASTTCGGSTAWQMRFDPVLLKRILTFGGTGRATDNNSWFKLEEIPARLPFYMLVYCINDYNRCGEVFILRETGSKKRLVFPLTKSISEIPFYVTISKAGRSNNFSILNLPA